MLVYPEIESWNEFYPSEIFIRLGLNETMEDAFTAFKNANIGATIHLGLNTQPLTLIFKKIG